VSNDLKKILLVSDGIFHPPLLGRIALHRFLRQMDGFSFEHIRSLEQMPEDTNKFSAMVLHFHHKRISPKALAHLAEFVQTGGGILALHAATASFKKNALTYFELLGGRFSGHGKVEMLAVKNNQSEIFEDIPDFVVRDELYTHELNDRIQVHFNTSHEGKDIPMVWTALYGKGKVCYAMPGHTSASMRNQNYQKVLRRGLEWVSG
jgi:type 1 glutamine amidotransferase